MKKRGRPKIYFDTFHIEKRQKRKEYYKRNKEACRLSARLKIPMSKAREILGGD